ncbi:MAG: DUF2357 domain-containing protein [Eubacteriales bacterium]|nr:DUF2357 domain-containing protein [Eubacteriales bacterium]
MADTIDELYSKYTSQVEEALEDDRYFQYLFEMIQAGDNTLQQKNRVLHKVVDERWLTVVEEGIKAIFNIVDKPRRFIATTEEVVPVALAKKITADSVRHLSQNTQFIAQNADGEIHPTKILNVTTEESFDLYENRFVYHLIQRLFAFVDKRTDVIFWSTGDETCNVMSMESKVDDAYEQISYKVEMTIKNRQSYVENDDDHMEIFKRIDHVRRMSRALRTSSFCDIMNGCAKVRSPIQRTNLMMKDPDYRTCYQLWQFIESYDEVGYTIEERDSAMEFDEEYLLQMYINMITNYTVFKSLLEADPRRLTELASKKREPVKPKFIKEIKEEIVEDRNIPDVEIRQVFVEEVTQAQLDAEARLKEETERREQLEKSVNNLEWQVESLNQEMQIAEQTHIQLEEEKDYLMTQLESETTTRKKAEEAVLQAQTEAEAKVEQVQAEAETKVEQAQTDAKKNLEQAQEEARQHVEQLQNEHEQYVIQIKSEADRQIVQVKNDASVQIQQIRDAAAQDIEKAIAEENNAKDIAKKAVEENYALNEMIKATQMQITALEEQLERIRRESAEAISKVEREKEEAVTKAEKEREEAIAKAEANSLSHYIVNALQERKERKKSKEDNSEK